MNLNVMIVEDELLFREYLRHAVNWDEYGLQVCCEAKNGEEAIDLLQKHCPDIALIDISIPRPDGMELAEIIRDQYSGCCIIFITGHNEFEFARKAIKFDASDYILKPCTREELADALLKAKKKISQQQITRDNLLNLLLRKPISETSIEVRLNNAGIDIHYGSYVVATAEYDNIIDSLYGPQDEVPEDVLKDILGRIHFGQKQYAFVSPENMLEVLICDKDPVDDQALEALFEQAIEEARGKAGISVRIGVGSCTVSLEGISNSYLQSLEALKYKFIYGGRKVISYRDISAITENKAFYPAELNEKLIEALRTANSDEVERLLMEAFGFIKVHQPSLEYTQAILTGLISLCISYIVERGLRIEDVFGEGFSPFEEIKGMSYEKALRRIGEIYRQALECADRLKISKPRKLLESVCKYIEDHYANSDLGLEEVANNVYINSSYLRRILKSELNTTFTDYLTTIRLNKARDLINNEGNIRLSDISEQVGYSDAGYFSKCFKRKFGISPSEYENSKK